jgi:hypothetical protein
MRSAKQLVLHSARPGRSSSWCGVKLNQVDFEPFPCHTTPCQRCKRIAIRLNTKKYAK